MCTNKRYYIFHYRNRKHNQHGATSSQLIIFKQLSNQLTNNKLKVNYTYTHILHQNPSNRYLEKKGKQNSKCTDFDDFDKLTLNRQKSKH